MPQLVSVTFPIALARAEALTGNRQLADSANFQAKVVLSQAFGEGAVRPWRLLNSASGVHTLAGWVRDAALIAPNPKSRRLGVITDNLDWQPPGKGEIVALDVLAAPQRQLARPDGKRIYLDVSSTLDALGRIMSAPPSERPIAWSQWFARSLTAPRTGIEIVGNPTIVEAQMITTIRAERRDPLKIQTARALVRARIVEPSAFLNFLTIGFKKNKDIGLGCVLPAALTIPSLMTEAA